MADWAAMVERRDEQLASLRRDLAESLRLHTATDYPRVLATYGSAYANGWRAGRERAAELVEEGETT